MALSVVVFDFDGTLVRTREASWALFAETNERFGLGIDTPEAFYGLFDGNFYAALDDVAGGAKTPKAEEVRKDFLGRLRSRYRPDLVPGMGRVVHDLAGTYTLAILSSNTMEAVRDILLANRLAQCFAHVFSGDVAPDKHEALRRLVSDPGLSCGRRCSPHYEEATPLRASSPDELMLVTDTVGDVEAGLAAGIRVGAVAWGMHSAEALEQAGAEFVCIWPEELVAYLRPGERCAAGPCVLPAASGRVAASGGSPAGIKPAAVTDLAGSAARGADTTLPAATAARQGRRQASAARLTSSLSRNSSSSSTGAVGDGDPVLRRVLVALATRRTSP